MPEKFEPGKKKVRRVEQQKKIYDNWKSPPPFNFAPSLAAFCMSLCPTYSSSPIPSQVILAFRPVLEQNISSLVPYSLNWRRRIRKGTLSAGGKTPVGKKDVSIRGVQFSRTRSSISKCRTSMARVDTTSCLAK